MKMIFKLPILLLTLWSYSQFSIASAFTSSSTTPESLVISLGERAIKALDGSQNSIDDTFLKILDEDFDLDYISSFVMGRYWKAFNGEQQTEFKSKFRKYLKKTYAVHFNEYKGVSFKIKQNNTEKKANEQIVHTTIQKPGGIVTPVDWTISSNNKVQDVVIEGISMGITMRNEFSTAYQRHGNAPDAFLKYLGNLVG